MGSKLNTNAIRNMVRARVADMERHNENPGAILRGTVPGLCNEVDRLRAVVARVEALADELDKLAQPYLNGSMFFDDAPTTRLRARASVRRDVAAAIRAALAGDA